VYNETQFLIADAADVTWTTGHTDTDKSRQWHYHA